MDLRGLRVFGQVLNKNAELVQVERGLSASLGLDVVRYAVELGDHKATDESQDRFKHHILSLRGVQEDVMLAEGGLQALCGLFFVFIKGACLRNLVNIFRHALYRRILSHNNHFTASIMLINGILRSHNSLLFLALY